MLMSFLKGFALLERVQSRHCELFLLFILLSTKWRSFVVLLIIINVLFFFLFFPRLNLTLSSFCFLFCLRYPFCLFLLLALRVFIWYNMPLSRVELSRSFLEELLQGHLTSALFLSLYTNEFFCLFSLKLLHLTRDFHLD